MQELQLLLAEYKRKRICAYCGNYKVKDFRTRKDKDERAIRYVSAMY